MAIRTVVLDFDGTCTDVEQEGQGFLSAFKQDLACMLRISDVDAQWEDQERRVLADPGRYGMVMNGLLVAPPVDLYLLATAIGGLIAPSMTDADSERLFRENYKHTTCSFKADAKAVIEALLDSDVTLHVVTNSDSKTVLGKLQALAPQGLESLQLRGNARKFLVTPPQENAASPAFAALPESEEIPGWPREIYLRRGLYFDSLAAIWSETETRPEETLVIGDVYELDLALPAHLGCRVHLAESPRTLAYEKDAVRSAGGTHSADLWDALQHVPGRRGGTSRVGG